MKKVFWICLALIVIAGIGVGAWFMQQEPVTQTSVTEDSTDIDVSSLALSEAVTKIESVRYLSEFAPVNAAMTQLEVGSNVVLFAPAQTASDTLLKDSGLSVEKFLGYHIVVSDVPITVEEGVKLRTQEGSEVNIIKKDNALYVRDAKGNDVRLRKPLQAQNGSLYIIDSVLLTQ